ncbi:MAG TPA: hypothetical protein VIV40_37275, partial [Kofleriaceae bacterium]
MKRFVWLLLLASCGGGHHAKPMYAAPAQTIGLQSVVAMQAWYRSPAPCGQGPYEIVIPTGNAK